MAKVTIRIPRNPKAPRVISVDGVQGASCKDLTAGIQKALGNTTEDVETEEFHEVTQEDVQVMEQ